MRIRNYRQVDVHTLNELLRLSAVTDEFEVKDMLDVDAWLVDPGQEAVNKVFVVTDDDDSNEWGQGGTLEGVEGEIVGFTAVVMHEDAQAYHFLCRGTVHPQFRRRNAGRALLICALNHARSVSAEFEFEAEEEGRHIFLEALLPLRDLASASLAEKCDMQMTDESMVNGMKLYRREL
ncbi:MAG TPA: GNAT family N-acetyltransferase [Ktedonobacteraceae bacterium]|nr:GNAT family N-acetyltransferase [Ktedonobacteraceae bacterium]